MSDPFPAQRAPLALTGAVLVAWLVGAGWPGLGPTAAGSHAFLAVGALPLILIAIAYFTPTLTRTGSAGWVGVAAPAAALAGGAAVAWGLAHGRPRLGATVGAALGLAAAIGQGVWIEARARRAVGEVHPGLRWYQASLACLAGALLLIVAGVHAPARYAALRAAHLHLNLLGFVGLAAQGTLPVLLPTVAGAPDPTAATRLAAGLPWALGGAVAVAAGAGVATGAADPTWRWAAAAVAALGALAWLSPLASQARATAASRHALLAASGGAAFVVAGLGAVIAVGAGALAVPLGAGGRPVVFAFELAFLLPLATGALTHLAPVWRWPGPHRERRERMRSRLGRGTGSRSLLFLVAGCLALAGRAEAFPLAAAGLAWFLVAGALAARR